MDNKKLQSILGKEEGENFECKRSDADPKNLLRAAVALANTSGGLLVIGLEDASKAKGVKRLIGINGNDDKISEFFKKIEKDINPPISYHQTKIDIVNTKKNRDKLVIVEIKKDDQIHSLNNADTYIRRGSQSVKIGAQEIIRLQYEKGIARFEEEKTNITTLDDLDNRLLQKYREGVQGAGQDVWQFLKDNGLAGKHNNNFHLTKAGILLFGENPSVLLGSKCSVKISHYYGTKQTYSGKPNFIRRPFSIEGPLLYQIQETVKYFKDVAYSSPPKLQGATFNPNNSLIIPVWAFQEAITNAVIHRNYFTEDDIHIRFFDDRIEIESPGTYPGHITPHNIRSERFSRNSIIQRTLNRFNEPPNLDIGEGVDRMFETMQENNLYNPLYAPPYNRPNSVLLTLFNLHKIEYWDTVDKYLDENHIITNGQARQITGVKDTLEMSRFLKNWVDKGLLERLGKSNRDAHYKKTNQKPGDLFSKDFENK